MSVNDLNSRIAAIVVTFNRKDLLHKNIESLLAQTRKECLDVLIIDNASTDGTYDSIKSYIENNEIQYFNTGSNLGGAGGFSFGIKLAAEMGYGRLWILDDDTLPTPTALEQLIIKDNEYGDSYGFLSSKVLWKDGSLCTMNIQKISKWKRMKLFDSETKIQYASFVSLFLRSSVVMSIGLPYKDFFIWADDWEYTRRISKTKPCYFVPSSIVNHWCVTNVGADIVAAPSERIDRFNYMYRNDVVLYRQDGFEGKLYLFVRNMTHRLRIILKSDYKKDKLAIISKGTKEGKKFFPSIEYPNAR